jgi:uncharacterized membrane protein
MKNISPCLKRKDVLIIRQKKQGRNKERTKGERKMKIPIRTLTYSALILALAIVVQSVKMPQYLTGPLVNALLFTASALVGPLSGVLVGLFTPLLAFSFGIMPLAPAIPVIVLGNCFLAIFYGLFAKKPILAVIVAAFAKFAVMTLSVYYLFPLLLQITFPQQVVTMLTVPQLATALAGGALALIVLKAVQWQKIKR